MSTAVENTQDQTQTGPSVEDAKTREQGVREQLKSAKSEVTKAKRAVTAAEKAVKSANDEQKADAEKALDAAKDTLAVKASDVDRLDAEAAQAKLDVRAAREREKTAKAEQRASKPKKAGLTLSQRRALLRLADGPLTPHTEFNQLPLQHLVRVGLAQIEEVEVPVERTTKVNVEEEIPEAERVEGGPTTRTVKQTQTTTEQVQRNQYSLTELGIERAQEINPKWKSWKAPSGATTTPATGDAASTTDDAAADQPAA